MEMSMLTVPQLLQEAKKHHVEKEFVVSKNKIFSPNNLF